MSKANLLTAIPIAASNLMNRSVGNGGSVNSAGGVSKSYATTNGTAATIAAQQNAQQANTSALEAWREAAQYNAQQAQIQRDWQEKMANTQYQRSVADMKAAGLNPILAATAGFGSSGYGTGSSASMSTPNTFMAGAYADSNSASSSNEWANGNSWNSSESGFLNFAEEVAKIANNAVDKVSSGYVVSTIQNQLAQAKKGRASNNGRMTVDAARRYRNSN